MTYATTHTYLEDDYAEVVVKFVVADSYENLYVDDAIEVGIFEPDGVKVDLEATEGYMVEDEIAFTMSEAEVETEDDLAAIEFVREADNQDVKRYVAIFYNPSSTPTVNQLRMAAVIRPGMQGTDLIWHGDQFGDEPSPLREWKCSAQSWFTNVMDRYTVEQLVEGDTENNVPGISEEWIAAHVYNKRSYTYANDDSASRGVNFCDLVNLNFLLKALSDNLHTALLANSVADITFSYIPARTDFLAVPCKWNALSFEVGGIAWNTLYVENPIGWEIGHHHYELPTVDALPFMLGLTSGGQDNTFTYPYIDFKRIKVGDFDIPDFGISSYMIPKKVKTFTDLLYATAEAFNCYLGLKFISHTQLSIRFIPRSQVANERYVYPRDVEKASLDTKPIEASSLSKIFKVRAHKLADDGDSFYYSNTEPPEFSADTDGAAGKKDTEQENLLFSVSITTCRIGGIRYADSYYDWASLPHNAAFGFADGSLVEPLGRTQTTRGNTTALFMHVYRTEDEHPYSVIQDYFTNVGAVGFWDRTTNKLQLFNTLPDYLNSQRARERGDYQFEYSLEVPYITSFRRSQDGTHADDDGGRGSWKNLDIGNKQSLDLKDYVVVGYEQKFKSVSTSIKLKKASRYSFSSAEAPELPGGGTPEYPLILAPIPTRRPRTVLPGIEDYYASDAIIPGQAVAASNEDQYIERATTIALHYERIVGVAVSIATTEGEIVRIAKNGTRVDVFPEGTFEPGKPVYLTNADPEAINLSNLPITVSAPGAVYHVQVGVSDTSSSMLIDIRRGWLYSEGVV